MQMSMAFVKVSLSFSLPMQSESGSALQARGTSGDAQLRLPALLGYFLVVAENLEYETLFLVTVLVTFNKALLQSKSNKKNTHVLNVSPIR